MTNVSTLPSLRLLDLGYNSIRHITGVQHLSHLEKLFLGRNKIETISVVLTQNAFIAGIGRTSPPHPRSAEQSNSILPWTRHSHRPPRTVLFGWDWRADISRIMEFQKSRGWKRWEMLTRSIWRTISSQTRGECRDSQRWSSFGCAAERTAECSCHRTKLKRLKRWKRSARCLISMVYWKRCIWNTHRFTTCRITEKSAWHCFLRWNSWIRTLDVLWNKELTLLPFCWKYFYLHSLLSLLRSSFDSVFSFFEQICFLYCKSYYFTIFQSATFQHISKTNRSTALTFC